MALEPQGAALMVPSELGLLHCMFTTGWLGRNGARCSFLKQNCQVYSTNLTSAYEFSCVHTCEQDKKKKIHLTFSVFFHYHNKNDKNRKQLINICSFFFYSYIGCPISPASQG